MIFILTLLISCFWMATLLVPLLIVFKFLNLFGLPEYLVIWLNNARHKTLTDKLLQEYQYHKPGKGFSKFYRRHYELISKYDTRLKHFCYKAYRNLNFMAT